MIDDTPHRRYSGSAAYNHKFLVPVVVNIKTVSVRPADEELVPYIVLKHLTGNLAHTADSKIHKTVCNTAYGDRCFTEFRNGYLKKLSGLNIAIEGHPEGVF